MYGPLIETWGPAWQLLWHLHLVSAVTQTIVLLTLLVGLVLALRDRRAAQPTGG